MLNTQSEITNPLRFLNASPVLLLWCITALVYCVFAVLYTQIPINPDDAVFAYIGWMMSEGGTVYVDAADQNWPGQMIIHWLSALLFGNALWAYRALEVLLILPFSAWLLYRFVDQVYDRFAAILVVLLFPAMYMLSGFWNAGQRDIIAGPLLIGACWMMQQRFAGAGWHCLILQGLLIAMATIIRPTMLIFGPLLFLVDLLFMSRHQRSFAKVFLDHVIVAATILLTAALVIFYGSLTGSLAAWYEISVLFATQVYSQSIGLGESLVRVLPNLLNSWKLYLFVAVVGAFLLFKKNRVAFILILAVVPAAFISFLVQGKALGYHLSVMYSSLSILVAVALSMSFTILLRQKVAVLMLLLALALSAITVAGIAKKGVSLFASPLQLLLGQKDRYQHLSIYQADAAGDITVADTLQAAEYIIETTPNDATVLFWARPTHINIISGRPSPLREASIALLIEPTERFTAYSSWYTRIDTMFKQAPPQVLLLAKDEDTGDYVGFDKQNPQKGFSAIVMKNLPRYQKEQVFGNTELYRLKN